MTARLPTCIYIHQTDMHLSNSDAGPFSVSTFALFLQVKKTIGEMFN